MSSWTDTLVPPVCVYCDKRVGDNEFDGESGGYFSSHSRCSTETLDGRFKVVALLDGEPYGSRHGYGYTTLKRAKGQADYLAGHNSARWTFVVRDGEHEVGRYDGRLRRV